MGVADFELQGKCNLDHFDSLGQGGGSHKDNSDPGALVPLQELIRKKWSGKIACLGCMCYLQMVSGTWETMARRGEELPKSPTESCSSCYGETRLALVCTQMVDLAVAHLFAKLTKALKVKWSYQGPD